jgi:uncharacterized protein
LALRVLFDAASPTDGAEPGKFVQLAMNAKQTRLILAHAHAMAFSALLVYEILARYPWWPRRVWVDISGTAALLADGPYAEQFTWILRKMGTDRVLFGSDWGVFDPRQAVEAVTALGFTEAEQRAIFYDNATQLLNVKGCRSAPRAPRRELSSRWSIEDAGAGRLPERAD